MFGKTSGRGGRGFPLARPARRAEGPGAPPEPRGTRAAGVPPQRDQGGWGTPLARLAKRAEGPGQPGGRRDQAGGVQV